MNPTNEHREQAREIAQRIAEIHPPVDGQWVAARCPEWMAKIEQIHTAYINQRLAEVREVLEGLRRKDCWCDSSWPREAGHQASCTLTTALYTKLHPKEVEDADDETISR